MNRRWFLRSGTLLASGLTASCSSIWPFSGSEDRRGTGRYQVVGPDRTSRGGEGRLLSLRNQQGDSMIFVAASDDSFDNDAMNRLTWLMRDRRSNETHPIDPRLPIFLLDVRQELNLPPETVLTLLSGYRSPRSNDIVGGATRSQHLFGRAADIRIPGIEPTDIFLAADRVTTGAEYGGRGNYPLRNLVHLDVGPKRSWEEQRTRGMTPPAYPEEGH